MSNNINKKIAIFGGGTISHICSHFALSAPAYGTTARRLLGGISEDPRFKNFLPFLHLTRMASHTSEMVTNDDVKARVQKVVDDPQTKIVFFSCAMVDYEVSKHVVTIEGRQVNPPIGFPVGKYTERPSTHAPTNNALLLKPTEKVINLIRKKRKDIFLVGFKTTCGATGQQMFEKGLKLCKEASCNLVVVNDTQTRLGMIVTPEEAAYHETHDRAELLYNLVEMVYYRSHLTFTQSTVVEGKPVPWSDSRVPAALRTVVEHCIAGDAYKAFNGSTVGHFATKLSDTEFLTSIRKSNLNKLEENGLVYVKTSGPDTVLAYGAKPSVGGQSQRMVFRDHPGYDCIVHFHSPLKDNHPDDIKIVSQREVECGSHQCGQNTSDNLSQFGNLKAVMLDKHGPNIVFPKSIDPQEVIAFIDRNFDLSKKTGGYRLPT